MFIISTTANKIRIEIWVFPFFNILCFLECKPTHNSCSSSNLLLLYGPTHTNVEVFIPELNRWVVMDPSYGCYFTLEGEPLSAASINEILTADIEKLANIKVQYVEVGGGMPKWNKSTILMYNNVSFFKDYLMPVIQPDSFFADIKNIILSSSDVYFLSSSQPRIQQLKKVALFLNGGHMIIKVFIPILIIINCLLLGALLLNKIFIVKK